MTSDTPWVIEAEHRDSTLTVSARLNNVDMLDLVQQLSDDATCITITLHRDKRGH